MSVTKKSWSLASACCLGIAALGGGCGGDGSPLDEDYQLSQGRPGHCTIPALSPGGGHGIADRVQLQEDLRDIDDLQSRYVYAVDAATVNSAKVNDILALLTDDVCLDFGTYGTFQGKPSVQTFFQTTPRARAAWSFHVTDNPLLTVNGSDATGLWRILAFGVLKADYAAGVQNFFASYHDAFVKTQTGWKIRTIMVGLDTPPTGP